MEIKLKLRVYHNTYKKEIKRNQKEITSLIYFWALWILNTSSALFFNEKHIETVLL